MQPPPHRILRGIAIAAALSLLPDSGSAQVPLSTEVVASGMGTALFVTHTPEDRERLFVVDRDGLVWIINNGVKLATPFLDITALTIGGGEQGLLGMAFHPDYAANGWFFVNYTDNVGDTRVDRYTVSADPDLADSASGVQILFLGQPSPYHNGGCIRFGPDGFLYIATGDGGLLGNPAQDGLQLLGKMLRLDVDHGLPYSIPASNPFVGNPAILDEIWALGLRNPWRFTFDRKTGDMYITDVGQALWEYVHFEPGGDPGARNYGWDIIEGSHCNNPSVGCNMSGLEMPIYEYAHSSGPLRCAIIGAEMYRGRSMASMHGRFFFSDFCSTELWSFRHSQTGGIVDFTDHTSESGVFGSSTSLGTDLDGELYLCWADSVRRVVPAGMYLKVPHLFTGVPDTIEVVRCTPNTPVYLAFSLVGVGSFLVAQLGVTLMLDSPFLAATTAADGAGVATFQVLPPGASFDRTFWIEAVQSGGVSNVTVETVE